MSEMSPTAYMNLIDAVDYCRNLTENGITNWRFPTYGDLVNFIDPKYSQDMIWVADFDGTQVASQTITKNYFGSIRLSDGYWSVTTPADTANKVRCVAQTGGGSGGGSLQISFQKDYSKDGNSTVPTTENIGSHDFCALTRYGEGVTSDSTAGYCKVEK